MKYHYRLSCPDCTDIDSQGCFDGGTYTSEDKFDTPQEARNAGYEATRRTIYEYEVVDEFQSLEHSIVEAAHNNDDRLDDLLRQACETMDEDRCNRLLDTVHQIMSEALRQLRGWKDELDG